MAYDWAFYPASGNGVFTVLSEAEARHLATLMPGTVRHEPRTAERWAEALAESEKFQAERRARRKALREAERREAEREAVAAGRRQRSSRRSSASTPTTPAVSLSRLVRLALSRAPSLDTKLERLIASHVRSGQATSRVRFIGLPLRIDGSRARIRVAFATER